MTTCVSVRLKKAGLCAAFAPVGAYADTSLRSWSPTLVSMAMLLPDGRFCSEFFTLASACGTVSFPMVWIMSRGIMIAVPPLVVVSGRGAIACVLW